MTIFSPVWAIFPILPYYIPGRHKLTRPKLAEPRMIANSDLQNDHILEVLIAQNIDLKSQT